MAHLDINIDSEAELCLIDCGLQSLRVATLRPSLRVLNVHCNQITRIEALEQLHLLTHLDVSSNQLTRIEGLGTLVNLRTLNLACNRITAISGIRNLLNLVKLNVSFNQIRNIEGLREVWGHNHKLSHLELHGNGLSDLRHVLQSLSGCVQLRSLTLNHMGADNPICNQQGYRQNVFSSVPQLQSLDNLDEDGLPAQQADILADVPGLDQYMDYLFTSSSSEPNPIAVATPRIDAAMELFKQRGVTSPEMSSTSITDTSQTEAMRTHTPKKAQQAGSDHEAPVQHSDRISRLEQQITQLLQQSHMVEENNVKATKARAKRDIDDTEESESSSSGSRTQAHRRSSHCVDKEKPGRKTMNRSKGDTSRKAVNETTTSTSSRDAADMKRSRGTSNTTPVKGPRSQPTGRLQQVSPSPQLPGHSDRARGHTAAAQDEEQRDDVRSTYVQLMRELEGERERRWKAEQAVKKLADHIQHLQSQAAEGEELQGVTIQATQRLKQALTNEREAKSRAQAELELAKEEVAELRTKCEGYQEAQEGTSGRICGLEEEAARRGKEHMTQLQHEAKRLSEAQMRASAVTREVELLRAQNQTLKGQLQQLQELLAHREQEHRKQLEGCYKPDSRELRDLLNRDVARVEKAHTQEVKLQQERVDTLTKQYAQLEDEFRTALQIESSRFKEVQEAYEMASNEAAQTRQSLNALRLKDEKSAQLVSELTSMVKEQKGRITELSRGKHEQIQELKERVLTLETHLEEARRRMVQMELLKKEKVKLESQVQGLESMVEGLKSERRLWGEELAQQGTSLAQDRGRLEAKIETSASEISSLKRQLEREADTVRIKTKMVEDQTETIRKMKEALLERDAEIKKVREEAMHVQRDLESQLSAETAANQEIQERLDRARERKDELKQQVTDLQDEVEQSKEAHSVLNNKWKEKSNLIGELESQVKQMRDRWEGQERKLREERDKAIQAARIALDKLQAADNGFRQQLDATISAHQRELATVEVEKQKEVESANARVIEVEDEMRQLLREMEANKESMETKLKKLTQAFSDLQHDF